jgi:hypothetical protein
MVSVNLQVILIKSEYQIQYFNKADGLICVWI